MANTRIGIIGFGNMGSALAHGLSTEGHQWGAFERIPQLQEKVTGSGGVLFATLEDLLSSCHTVVLAIKPQDMATLLAEIKPEVKKNHLFISIAAGLSLDFFSKGLGTSKVVRYMPNLAAKVGQASVGVSFDPSLTAEEKELAMDIARAIGYAHEIPEKLQSAITGLSGSGIAFVYQFIHAMALGGVKEGFAYPKALEIALETTKAAVASLQDAGVTPAEMITRVTSPAGTTIEGISVLEDGGLTPTVIHAVGAASERARELES